MNLYERFYMYLFGFGSLVNIKSAQNSFKNRELKKEDLIPVKIRGYKRVWNSIESICFEKEIVNGIFLNIQKDENSYIFWGYDKNKWRRVWSFEIKREKL